MAEPEKEEHILDKFSRLLTKTARLLKGPYKATTGAVVAACLGGLLKLAEITKTFPPPADIFGNAVIFVAVLIFVADVAKGGLFD